MRDVLHELSTLENVEGEISVGYVGYYYNPQLKIVSLFFLRY